MKDRHALIFWMGGVITESLLEVSTNALEEMGQPGINLLSMPGFSKLSERLFLGKINDLQFFNEITAEMKTDLDIAQILFKVKGKLHPCFRTLNAINLIPPRYQRWLICEFPVSWFEQLNTMYGMTNYFRMDHVLFLSTSGLDQIIPDLFDYLPEKVGDTPEKCLYFDKNPKRVIAAINRTFPAVIYVDPSRLEREFVMRNFIERPQPRHTPPVTLEK